MEKQISRSAMLRKYADPTAITREEAIADVQHLLNVLDGMQTTMFRYISAYNLAYLLLRRIANPEDSGDQIPEQMASMFEAHDVMVKHHAHERLTDAMMYNAINSIVSGAMGGDTDALSQLEALEKALGGVK